MLSEVRSYLRFITKSTNEHGVHSPFVFDLVTRCFYDKRNYPEYKILQAFRDNLLQNQNHIEVTDFGAGSRVFKSNDRKISDIAKNAGISKKRAELLFRLTRYFNADSVLEIGTSVGLATSALALGNPSAQILTLEGCPRTANVAMEQFAKFNLENIRTRIGEFTPSLERFVEEKLISNLTRGAAERSEVKSQITPEVKPNGAKLNSNHQPPTTNHQPSTTNHQPPTNLIYFDGNHSKAATLAYFEQLLPTVTNDSVWIFDDIHWSKDMEDAWEQIKAHAAVTVTIDTFQWGLVFFRSEQQKEHFTIRV